MKDTSLASGGTSGGPTSSSSSPSQRNLKQTEIWLNGKLFSSPMAFAWNHTTYMPIWYVMEVLQRIGVTQPRPWDGTHWYMATKNGLFTAYKMDGTKLQDYATLSDAEAAVSNVPGADVKDGSGNCRPSSARLPGVCVSNENRGGFHQRANGGLRVASQ